MMLSWEAADDRSAGDEGAPGSTAAESPVTPRPAGSDMTVDPSERSRWRPVRLLMAAMDDEIARVYDERGVQGIRPRYAMPLIRLGRQGAMTISELAESTQVTHSAMSQTVSQLRREGLVRSVPGKDARTRRVTLTRRAHEVVSFLEAEWQATEQALAELEAEIPYPLSQVVRDIEVALARRSFHDRVESHLSEQPLLQR